MMRPLAKEKPEYKWPRAVPKFESRFFPCCISMKMEMKSHKKIILVGDKVLIAADKESERTPHGLYLPPGVKEKDRVQAGYVVSIGPGHPIPNPQFIDQESWSTTPKEPVK